MFEKELDFALEWYENFLDLKLEKPDVKPFPKELKITNFDSALFVVPLVSCWEENGEHFKQQFKTTLDKVITSLNLNYEEINEIFDENIKIAEEEGKKEEKRNEKLIKYFKNTNFNTIYYMPLVHQYLKQNLVMKSFMVHELFHLYQINQDLKHFSYMKEPAAWAMQIVYGNNLSIKKINKQISKIEYTKKRSIEEQDMVEEINLGKKIIFNEVNINEDLKNIRQILNKETHEKLDNEIIFQTMYISIKKEIENENNNIK